MFENSEKAVSTVALILGALLLSYFPLHDESEAIIPITSAESRILFIVNIFTPKNTRILSLDNGFIQNLMLRNLLPKAI